MRGIADEALPSRYLREQALAEGDAVLLAHVLHAMASHTASGVSTMKVEVSALNLVGVGLEPAVLGLSKAKVKASKVFLRAQPDKAALRGSMSGWKVVA